MGIRTPPLHHSKISSTPQHHSSHEHPEDFFTKLYRRVMGPLLHHTGWRWTFLIGITVLLLGSAWRPSVSVG